MTDIEPKYSVSVEGQIASGTVMDPPMFFDDIEDAGYEYAEKRDALVDVLHRLIVEHIVTAEQSEIIDFQDGETWLEASLTDTDDHGNVQTLEMFSVTPDDVYVTHGYTGTAWKIEVHAYDVNDNFIDDLDAYTLYPRSGEDPVLSGHKLLGQCLGEANADPEIAKIEVTVFQYQEIDDDGGNGEGKLLLQRSVEFD